MKIFVNIIVNIIVKVVKIVSPGASNVSIFDILFVKTLTWVVPLVHNVNIHKYRFDGLIF